VLGERLVRDAEDGFLALSEAASNTTRGSLLSYLEEHPDLSLIDGKVVLLNGVLPQKRSSSLVPTAEEWNAVVVTAQEWNAVWDDNDM